MTRKTVVVLATLAAACGIPEKKYQAAVSEAADNMRRANDAVEGRGENRRIEISVAAPLSAIETRPASP